METHIHTTLSRWSPPKPGLASYFLDVFLHLLLTCASASDKPKLMMFFQAIWRLILLDVFCRLSLDKQKPSLDVAYRFYDDDECGLTNEQRRSALEHVVLQMLQAADDSAVVEFFTDHISGIMAAVETHRTTSVSLVTIDHQSSHGCFTALTLLRAQQEGHCLTPAVHKAFPGRCLGCEYD